MRTIGRALRSRIPRVQRRLAVAALFLAGCISIAPRPVDPAANAAQIAARRLDDPALRTYAEQSLGRSYETWPPVSWDLDTLTAAAFFFNDTIRVARADAAVAAAAIATARERPNPTASASLERKAEPGKSPWVSLFGIDLPIEPPRVRRGRISRAEETAAAERARIAGAAWNVRSALRSRLADVMAADGRLAALESQEETEKDIVEIFTKRVELGEAAQPELSRARIALAQTQLLIHDERRLAGEGQAGVAAAVGVPQSAIRVNPGASGGMPAIPSAIDDALRDAALTGRADVLAALHDYAAAEADLQFEIARQYPDVHVGPALGWDQGTRVWSLAASAEIPLLNHHRGPIGEAVARRDAAAARVTALQSSIIAAFDLARANFDLAHGKVEQTNAMMSEELAQLRSVRKQFEAGEVDRLALRTAELEMENAQLAAADAEIELQRAAGAVEDAIQRPLGATLPKLEASR